MPRTSVWFNQEQLDQLHKLFGEEVNLSGVVRLGLGQLLHLAEGRDRSSIAVEVSALSAIANVQDDLERLLGRAARVKAEAELLAEGRRR